MSPSLHLSSRILHLIGCARDNLLQFAHNVSIAVVRFIDSGHEDLTNFYVRENLWGKHEISLEMISSKIPE